MVLAALVWWFTDSDPVEPELLVPDLPQLTLVESAAPTELAEERVEVVSKPVLTMEVAEDLEPEPSVESLCFARERHEFEVAFSVRDAWQRSEPNTELFVAVDGQRFNRVPNYDGFGEFSLKFKANWSALRLHYFARHGDLKLTGVRTIDLTSERARYVSVDLLDLAAKCPAASATQTHTSALGAAPTMVRDSVGISHFVERTGLGLSDEPLLMRDRPSRARRLEKRKEDDGLFATVTDVSGTVTTEDGLPAAGALVGVSNPWLIGGQWTTTDKDGRYELRDLVAGRYSLHAGGDDFGTTTGPEVNRFGGRQVWDAKLRRGNEARGVILGSDDRPLQLVVRGGHGELQSAWSATTLSNAKGRFAFPNARTGAVRVSLLDPKVNPVGIPLHVVEAVVQDGHEHVVRLEDEELLHSTVYVSLRNADGEPVSDAEVLLLYPGRDCGVFMAPSPVGGNLARYSASGLPSGTYQLEARAPGLGSIQQHVFTVVPGLDLNLGTYLFKAPGTVVVTGGAEEFATEEPWRITRCGARSDSIVWVGTGASLFIEDDTDAPLELPEGEYLLTGETDSLGCVAVPFRVGSGLETVVALSLRKALSVTIEVEDGRRRDLVIVNEQTGREVIRTRPERKAMTWEVTLLPGTYRLEYRGRNQLGGRRLPHVWSTRQFTVKWSEDGGSVVWL